MELYETKLSKHQCPAELDAMVDLFRREGVRSYLEIGAKWGASLWRVGRALPRGSRIACVDLPFGTASWKETSESLAECVRDLVDFGRDARCIWGDSTDPVVVDQVAGLGPFDAVFLDANHTIDFVRQDWKNYGPMATKFFAFHDISFRPAPGFEGTPIEVPTLWAEITRSRSGWTEIKLDATTDNNGIGVLYMDKTKIGDGPWNKQND